MNTQSVTTRFVRNSSNALSDSDLNAVVGGRDKFCYVELNGNTYAAGPSRAARTAREESRFNPFRLQSISIRHDRFFSE